MTVQYLFDTRKEVRSYWRHVDQDLKTFGITMPEDPLILYIGCGWGYMLEFLTVNYRTIGLELDDVLDKWKKHGHKNVVQGDAHDLPFPNSSVDIVFESGLFDPDVYNMNRESIIQEVYRVLIPQGIFCYRDGDFPDKISRGLFQKQSRCMYTKISD